MAPSMSQCISLMLWLEERYETVYTRHPGFQKGSKPLLALDNPFPTVLPENLFGDQWAFVQLPFSGKYIYLLSLPAKFFNRTYVFYIINFLSVIQVMTHFSLVPIANRKCIVLVVRVCLLWTRPYECLRAHVIN